ncbi:ATP-binding response regulator [Chitinophaga arvensicola]|uniref:histidine kinase n=1 Tax=Chitinophaga arvensicola TaxID=29529 RepID=A0A1I0S6N2_9BACT|nr:ATP-binding protein [Chitinophaga arvensicola]SEW51162.1 Signal transduction histidine kinase [Chitinophaga arvensicola]
MRKSLLLFVVPLALVFLLLVLLFFSGYKIHHQSGQKLLRATDTLMLENPSIHLMDSALFTLNDAENNFRLYTVLYKRKYLETFSTELGQVLSMIDTVSGSLSGQSSNFAFTSLMKEKEGLSDRIATLKLTTDSMLTHSIKNEMVDRLLRSIPVYTVEQIKKEPVTMDTLNSIQQANTGKKGIFRRLGNAIANRNDTVNAQISIIVKTKGGKVIDKETYDALQLRKIVKDINTYYKNILTQQLNNRIKLDEEESTLAGTNIAMMEELKVLLTALREHATAQSREKKQAAHHIVRGSATKMLGIVIIGLVALLASLAAIAGATWMIRRNNRLLKAGKLAAEEQTRVRTDFLNNMSHEMRTPLNSVAGFTEQLSYTALNPAQQEIVNSITVATHMLVQVVNDVLDFSKLERDYISLTPQPFVLYQVFNEVVNIMRIQAVQKNLEFNASFEGDKNGQVKGDIFRLKQILLNLISNAIKYTEKGTITVTATLEPVSDRQSYFDFMVADTGDGIAPEALPHLFERFFQAGTSKSHLKGTGLGLAITKRLINLQGGEIEVSSELKKGSRFTGRIPYEKVTVPLMVPAVTNEIPTITGAHMEGRYVLIADDQEMNLLLLKLILTRWKCRFDMATDGQSALELFRGHHYDLVLLDVHMPVMDGIQVLEEIRKDKDPGKAAVVALALTANISADDETAFGKAGFNGWLMKPFREKEIYEVIMAHLKV